MLGELRLVLLATSYPMIIFDIFLRNGMHMGVEVQYLGKISLPIADRPEWAE